MASAIVGVFFYVCIYNVATIKNGRGKRYV